MRDFDEPRKREGSGTASLKALAIQNSGVAAFDWDLTQGAVEHYGFVIEQFSLSVGLYEIAPKWFLPNMHPDDAGTADAALAFSSSTDADTQFEHCSRYLLPSGKCVWILTKAQKTISTDHGIRRLTRLRGTLQDVSREREKEAHFVSVLESIGDGFVTFDEDWRYTFVNKKAEVLLGRSACELMGNEIWAIFPALVGTSLELGFRTAMAGTPTSYEYFYVPWGRWFTNFCSPKIGGGLTVYFQDITSRRTEEHERDLAKSRAALEQVNVAAQTLAALAHELNQPLMALQANWGSLTHLLKDVDVSPEVRSVLLESEKQTQRAIDVFSGLIGRINMWRQGNLTVSKYDIHALIESCVRKIIAVFPDISVESQLHAQASAVFGDPVQVEKALMNLLTNAAETWSSATSAKPFVVVTTQSKLDRICIQVRDYGPGVSVDVQKSLFTEFRSSKEFGLGLGLSISKSLVEAQGGLLWFQGNQNPGAEFRMELPVAA